MHPGLTELEVIHDASERSWGRRDQGGIQTQCAVEGNGHSSVVKDWVQIILFDEGRIGICSTMVLSRREVWFCEENVCFFL